MQSKVSSKSVSELEVLTKTEWNRPVEQGAACAIVPTNCHPPVPGNRATLFA